jgi:hypothetical protein
MSDEDRATLKTSTIGAAFILVFIIAGATPNITKCGLCSGPTENHTPLGPLLLYVMAGVVMSLLPLSVYQGICYREKRLKRNVKKLEE